MSAAAGAKAKQFRKRARSDSDDDDGGGGRAVVARPTAAADRKQPVNSFSTAGGASKATKDAATAVPNAYQSSGTAAPHQYAGGAFATSEIDTSEDRDAHALLERKLALQSSSAEALTSGQAVYRGLAGYGNFIEKDAVETLSRNKMTGTHGPLRAPTNVRGICRVDYQPDICKDYKETGFCGFGDSCKFLHDRGDYKSGWQLDQEWDAKQKAREKALAKAAAGLLEGDETGADADADNPFLIKDDDAEVDSDGLPFACFICREPFTSPIVTQCGHYFCEACATARYRDDHTCAVCSKQTHGIFNAAHKLAAKLRAAGKLRDASSGSSSSSSDASGGGGGWGGFTAVEDEDAQDADGSTNGSSSRNNAANEPAAPSSSSAGNRQFVTSFEAGSNEQHDDGTGDQPAAAAAATGGWSVADS